MTTEHSAETDHICEPCAEQEHRAAEARKRLLDLLRGTSTPPGVES